MKIVGILFALVLAVSLVLVPAAVFAQDECPSCCDNADIYGGLANCEWDTVKWQGNVDSWHLYLQHWGRTPIQAMTRLRGLCGPPSLCDDVGTSCPDITGGSRLYGCPNCCLGGCASCRTGEQGCCACCDDVAKCEQSCCLDTSGQDYCPTTQGGTCPSTPPSDTTGCNTDVVLASELPKCAGCWGVSLAFASKSWSAATIGTHPRISDAHLNHMGQCYCTGGNCGGDWGISGCPHSECCSLTWCLQDNCFASGNCAPAGAVPSVLWKNPVGPCPCDGGGTCSINQ